MQELRHTFNAAIGSQGSGQPTAHHGDHIEYTPKVKLEKKKKVGGGGCG